MDNCIEFCFEVPVIKVEDIEDLHKVRNCGPIVNKEVKDKDGTIVAKTFCHAEPKAKYTDCTNSMETFLNEEAKAKYNDCTFVAEIVTGEESLEKDKHCTILAKTLINYEAVAKENGCTIAMETFPNEETMAKDNDCTFVSEILTSKETLAKDKHCTMVAKTLINYEAVAKDNDCTIAMGTFPNVETMAKDDDCTFVSERLTSKETLAKGKHCTMVAKNLINYEALAKDNDCTIAMETLPNEEAMAKDNDCTFVAEILTSEETLAKDKHCTILDKILTNYEAVAKDMDCTKTAETLISKDSGKAKDSDWTIANKTFVNEIVIEEDEDCTIVDSVNSEISKPICTQNVCKKNKQLTDPVENHLTEPSPIIIDEDSEKDGNDCTIIDNNNEVSYENVSKNSKTNGNTSHRNDVFCYDEIYKENKLLTDLIEKCLDMENSTGMLRIINRTLIPIFKIADASYKKSDLFEKALSYTSIKLDTNPDKKFSHIKDLVELLKLSKVKKRLSLVTLKRNLNGKFSKNNTKFSIDDTPRKKKKIAVIDLDDDGEVHIDCNSDTDITINDLSQVIEDESSSLQVNDDQNNHVEIDDTDNDSDVQINEQSEYVIEEKDHNEDAILIIDDDENANSNKENRTSTKNNKTTKKHKARRKKMPIPNDIAEATDRCNETDKIDNSYILYNPGNVCEEIFHLEEQIANYNKVIQELDEAEVPDDDNESPYVKSEYYKEKVVSLYKELCRLTGTKSVKRHEVRLTAAEGHHEGPARCLEQFINNNIDENGDPPFPDMHDVISCVKSANTMFNMGWRKSRIEDEARALFIHYGRTVQKKRQMREWRHLMRYVKKEAPDPADVDPALEARLAENNVIAKKNEDELFDRFVQIENTHQNKRTRIRMDESENDSDYGSTSPLPCVSNLTTMTNSTESDNDVRKNSNEECSTSAFLTNNSTVYNPWDTNRTLASAEAPTSQNTAIGDVNNSDVNRSMESIGTYVTGLENNLEVIFSDDETLRSDVTDSPHNLYTRGENEVPEINKMEESVNNIRINHIELTSSYIIHNNEVKDTTNVKVCIPNIIEDRTNSTENSEAITSDGCGSKPGELNFGAESPQTDFNDVLVKRERLDIPKMLEQLGDNYTATIIDIEDPFMIIEISDSSESEDEGIQ